VWQMGERLQLTYAERERHRLWDICSYDVPKEAMPLLRRHKRRRYDKQRRQRQPRAEYLAQNTKSKEQPWVKKGISKASWYRRINQEQTRETGVHKVNLIRTKCTLVSTSRHSLGGEVGASVNAHVSVYPTATPACLRRPVSRPDHHIGGLRDGQDRLAAHSPSRPHSYQHP
jgi:hypothetical protein